MDTIEEYQFQISREDVQRMIVDARNSHTGTKKQIKLAGKFMSLFEANVFEAEKHKLFEPIKILKKNYYCYSGATRDGSALLNIDGKCSSCNLSIFSNKF